MTPESKNFSSIKHLCIGHCCHDLVEGSFILGGAASYSSLLSRAWGLETSLLTSVGDDFLFQNRFEEVGIEFHNVPANDTTIFQNEYMDNNRIQYLKSRAGIITADALHSERPDYDIVQFCPIADEIAPDLLVAFPRSLKMGSIQGFLRQWDKNGLVSLKEMNWKWLKQMDIVILSTEDIAEAPHYLNSIIEQCEHVIVTDGENGATVYFQNENYHYPAIKTRIVDATGAGDTFTTAYAIDYYENKNITSACSFAHSAASCIIENIGLGQIPNLSVILERKKKYLSDSNLPTPNKES